MSVHLYKGFRSWGICLNIRQQSIADNNTTDGCFAWLLQFCQEKPTKRFLFTRANAKLYSIFESLSTKYLSHTNNLNNMFWQIYLAIILPSQLSIYIQLVYGNNYCAFKVFFPYKSFVYSTFRNCIHHMQYSKIGKSCFSSPNIIC